MASLGFGVRCVVEFLHHADGPDASPADVELARRFREACDLLAEDDF